jgi:nicotinamide mononucleotide transporter
MGLQVYYVLISIFGWYWWLRGRKGTSTKRLRLTRIKIAYGLILFAIFIILFVGIWFILKYYTDSPVPAWDSFTTALSIIAMWMLARKIIEHWILWIVANLASIILYIYKGLYPTVILFGIYTAMAVIGYYKWRKEIDLQTD